MGPLKLVASPAAAEDGASGRRAPERRADGHLDWSRLMARAQDGDRQAYRTLLDDMTPYVRSLAHRCFKDASEIEDTVQDVLLMVHLVRHAYDPRRPFGPWLLSIANRRIIDRLRRMARDRSREMTLLAEHEALGTWPDEASGDGGMERTDETALHAAIGGLPPDQRQAIIMLKLKEMSLREAALASGRSVAALKVATHRAIHNLRKRLRPRSDAT